MVYTVFFFQAEDGIRDLVRSRGLGDVYKRQECYEGLAVTGDDDTDRATADALMARVQAVAADCDAQGLFETDEGIAVSYTHLTLPTSDLV